MCSWLCISSTIYINRVNRLQPVRFRNPANKNNCNYKCHCTRRHYTLEFNLHDGGGSIVLIVWIVRHTD